jgi:hypothetical protein
VTSRNGLRPLSSLATASGQVASPRSTSSFRQACITKEIRRSGGSICRLHKVLPVIPGHPAGGRLRHFARVPQ